jgi:hypothetical protein
MEMVSFPLWQCMQKHAASKSLKVRPIATMRRFRDRKGRALRGIARQPQMTLELRVVVAGLLER